MPYPPAASAAELVLRSPISAVGCKQSFAASAHGLCQLRIADVRTAVRASTLQPVNVCIERAFAVKGSIDKNEVRHRGFHRGSSIQPPRRGRALRASFVRLPSSVRARRRPRCQAPWFSLLPFSADHIALRRSDHLPSRWWRFFRITDTINTRVELVSFGGFCRGSAGSNGRVRWHAKVEPATRWPCRLPPRRSPMSFAEH